MLLKRPPTGTNCLNLLAFYVACGIGASGLLGACSSGETGLVLGTPLSGSLGGTGALGGTADSGGGDPRILGGQANLAGEPGAAGASTEPVEQWVADTCTPTISFINRDKTAQGQLFTDAVPDPATLVWQAAHDACRTLYRSASEVKAVSKISLTVYDYDGIASSAGTSLQLSTRYLKTLTDRGVDLRQEIAGILHFSTSLVYQNSGSDNDAAAPRWLMVGIADYVRLESGYLDRTERAKGGAYDGNSSQTTAFFLDYLATKNPNLVYQLNQRLAPTATAWSNDVFTTLLGSDIDSLWATYQATL